jgi:hypothetical protein
MSTLTARFFHRPASPGVVVIRRDSDGHLWDFTNALFTATPALDYQAPVEDVYFSGMYLFQLVQTWTGLYQLFWYPTSAKAGKPFVLSINLTAGAQDDMYGGLAESVRLEIDANSTQLTAILADTAEIGVAGAGLTVAGGTGDQLIALPWNAAWNAEVQSEATAALNAYDPPTNAEFVARTLPAADYVVTTDTIAGVTTVGSMTGNIGGNVTGSVGSLATQAKADVNAEIVDVLRVDTIPDVYPAHEAQPTLAQAILTIHQFLMEREVSGTSVTVQKPDGSTTALTLTINSATDPTTIHRSA